MAVVLDPGVRLELLARPNPDHELADDAARASMRSRTSERIRRRESQGSGSSVRRTGWRSRRPIRYASYGA